MKTAIGQRVRVLPSSKYYPGRVGVVERLNIFSQNLDGSLNHDGLWFVALEPTNRAKARVELIWGDDLEPMQDERQGVAG